MQLEGLLATLHITTLGVLLRLQQHERMSLWILFW